MIETTDVEVLKKALEREREARKQAERILEAKSAELYVLHETLKETNSRLESVVSETTSELDGVFQNIVDAYIVTDLRGFIIRMNQAAVDLLELEGKDETVSVVHMVDPKDYHKMPAGYDELVKKGKVFDFQITLNTKNRKGVKTQLNASLIYDKEGNPVAAQGILRDITKARQDQKRLVESENRLSTLIVNLETAVLLEDENRHIVLANKKFCEFFSIPLDPELLIGLDCSNTAEDTKHLFENPEEFITRLEEILANKTMVLGDEVIMSNGVVLERDFIPIVEEGVYKGHLWTYKDVTFRHAYDKGIEAQKQKYSSIIANMNLGLVEVDNDDRILMVNQSFCEMSGYEKHELLGQCASQMFAAHTGIDILQEEIQRRLDGGSSSYEIKIKNKQGEVRYWLISGAPNYNLKGEVIGSIGIHLDITDMKSLQVEKENLLSKLARSNDELQEYAHVVSHDLKSPLRSIDALVTWIKEDNDHLLDDFSKQNIIKIGDTLEKMDRLIGDVLNFSSLNSEQSEFTAIDFKKVIKDVEHMVLIPKHIKLKVQRGMPMIHGDKTKITQLFQNMLSNSVKFMDKEEGLIEITFEDKGKHVLFKVKDNGIGIDPAYHHKVFKIFNTLSQRKDSTGIGLSIVKKIVELHEGEIWLESELGKGTTFFFTLKK